MTLNREIIIIETSNFIRFTGKLLKTSDSSRTNKLQTCSFQIRDILHVNFISMSVPFLNAEFLSIESLYIKEYKKDYLEIRVMAFKLFEKIRINKKKKLTYNRLFGGENCVTLSQSHGSTHVSLVVLWHVNNKWMIRLWINFHAVCIFQAQNIPCKFNDCCLQS